MLKRVIAIANQKGGVGKTTTAINLSAALALAGKQVLFVDLDPQGNGTSGLGIKKEEIVKTVYDVFLQESIPNNAILETQIKGLYVLPSESDLFGVDVELIGREGREFILKRALTEVADGYEYIIIDCPPSLSLLTVNALSAVDSVIVPVQCQYYALEGLSQLLKTVDMFVEGLNPQLVVEGFLLTMYERCNALANNVVQEVRAHFQEQVFRTTIVRDVTLSEAPGFGKPVTVYAMRSPGAENYIELAHELLEKYEISIEAVDMDIILEPIGI